MYVSHSSIVYAVALLPVSPLDPAILTTMLVKTGCERPSRRQPVPCNQVHQCSFACIVGDNHTRDQGHRPHLCIPWSTPGDQYERQQLLLAVSFLWAMPILNFKPIQSDSIITCNCREQSLFAKSDFWPPFLLERLATVRTTTS